MADPKTLEEMTAQYRGARQKEIKEGFQRAMAGLSGSPQAIKYVTEKQAGLGAADRAALRSEVTQQMADFQAGLRLDPDLIKEAMKQAAALERQGSINNTDLDAIKYAAEVGGELARLDEQQGLILKKTLIDWDATLEGDSAHSRAFTKVYNQALADLEAGSPAWARTLEEGIQATNGLLKTRDTVALLGAIREATGYSNEELKSRAAAAGASGQSVWNAYNEQLASLAQNNEEYRALEQAKETLRRKGNKFGGENLSANGRKFVSAFLGGDPEAFAEMLETLGGGAARTMSPAEEEAYEGMKSTLEFLESGDPDSAYYRDMIMNDDRFTDWMAKNNYTSKQEAFKVWLGDMKTQWRREKRDTRRMEQINAAVGARPGAAKAAIGQVRASADQLEEAARAAREPTATPPQWQSSAQRRRWERFNKKDDDGAEGTPGDDTQTTGWENAGDDLPEDSRSGLEEDAEARRRRLIQEDAEQYGSAGSATV
jgi:hypothetical protein